MGGRGGSGARGGQGGTLKLNLKYFRYGTIMFCKKFLGLFFQVMVEREIQEESVEV